MANNKKYRGYINLDDIAKAIKQNPKILGGDDQYGKKIWCDLTLWEAGDIGLDVNTGDGWQKLGAFKLKEAYSPEERTKPVSTDDNLPF